MNCEQARLLLQPYADGELDAARILELEQHLRGCPTCAPALRNLQSLKTSLKQDALFFTAPAQLRRSIDAELHSQVQPRPESSFWNWRWNWMTTATSSFAAVCLMLLMAVTLIRPPAQRQLAQEIVSSHIRSLMASHELDVVSTDQHTVKPWFDGKLDFAPPVKDLAAQEFPLIGGRLDYLEGHTAASLVFQRHKHVINLFIWPAKDAAAPPGTVAAIQGYNLVHWSGAGMTFWAVSDLNEKELLEFAQDFGTN